MTHRLLLLLSGLLLATACTENEPAAPAKTPVAVAPAPAPAPPPPPPEEKLTESVPGKSDPDCIGPMTDDPQAKPEKLELGARAATITGYHLTLAGKPDADDQVVIGVLGDINEALPMNLALLDQYVAFFKSRNAEMIVVAGDIGGGYPGTNLPASRKEIQASLEKLGKSGLPVLAITGNQDPPAVFRDVMAEVHRKMPNVINGNRVRRVDWDDVTFFTLPGLHNKAFLHETEGELACQYHSGDLDDLGAAMKSAAGPVFLVAHGPPGGKAITAIDVVSEKKHAGDANLSKLIASAKVAFGVFPNIKESGGRATADTDGARVVKEGELSDALYVNPGAADGRVAWVMNDGTRSRGSVAVVTIKGKQASYEMFRAPAPEGDATGKPVAKDP